MCEVCGDFVRRRVVKGVWPVIAQSLTNLASGSKNSGPTYRYTVTYKLQRRLLETVGVLPVKLQVIFVECHYCRLALQIGEIPSACVV